jgi:CMP-N-acetylneuraminic acid synthetase
MFSLSHTRTHAHTHTHTHTHTYIHTYIQIHSTDPLSHPIRHLDMKQAINAIKHDHITQYLDKSCWNMHTFLEI